ncbi:MAG: hypothetical protein HQK92_03665 [Nitrospirae bacterium]|nr:hypothetical protein [Nitrospirota bacterium]
MKKILLLSLCCVLLFMMLSCKTTYSDYRADAVVKQQLSTVDIAMELCRYLPKGITCPDNYTLTTTKDSEAQERISQSLFLFNDNQTGNKYREHRNNVQNHILWLSDAQCSEFENRLKLKQDFFNTLTSGLATSFAGVASIVSSPLAVAKALSASSAITTGIQSEVNHQVYGELVSQILKSSIDAKRYYLLKDIQIKQTYCKRNYTIEAAIKDAIDYNNACSLISALETAKDAVTDLKSPAIGTMVQWINQYSELKTAVNNASSANPATTTKTQDNKTFTVTTYIIDNTTAAKAPLPTAWYNCDNETSYQLILPDPNAKADSKDNTTKIKKAPKKPKKKKVAKKPTDNNAAAKPAADQTALKPIGN